VTAGHSRPLFEAENSNLDDESSS